MSIVVAALIVKFWEYLDEINQESLGTWLSTGSNGCNGIGSSSYSSNPWCIWQFPKAWMNTEDNAQVGMKVVPQNHLQSHSQCWTLTRAKKCRWWSSGSSIKLMQCATEMSPVKIITSCQCHRTCPFSSSLLQKLFASSLFLTAQNHDLILVLGSDFFFSVVVQCLKP